MPRRKHAGVKFKPESRFLWILIALLIGVLILSVYALIDPFSQDEEQTGFVPTMTIIPEDGRPEEELELTQTVEVEALPPTPEEIGYTDGIIFMSSLLILILLVGTLREILHRRG